MKEKVGHDSLVYLLLYGHDELIEIIKKELIEFGFRERQIVNADPRKYAHVGDYFALVYPNDPSRMFIERIQEIREEIPRKENELTITFFRKCKRIAAFDLTE